MVRVRQARLMGRTACRGSSSMRSRATGRGVAAFMSANRQDPDLAVEMFVLETEHQLETRSRESLDRSHDWRDRTALRSKVSTSSSLAAEDLPSWASDSRCLKRARGIWRLAPIGGLGTRNLSQLDSIAMRRVRLRTVTTIRGGDISMPHRRSPHPAVALLREPRRPRTKQR